MSKQHAAELSRDAVRHSESPMLAGEGFVPAWRRVSAESGAARDRGRLFLLHGFLGSGRNWASIARGLVRARPDWEAILVDLRLHGDSEGAPPPHGVDSCALDLVRLAGGLPPVAGPAALLGHSFGGKVALSACTRFPTPPAQVWVIDSTPAPAATGAGAERMLDLIERLPPAFASRAAGADAVEADGFPRFVAEWMATNLVRRGEVYAWRFDRGAMRAMLEDFERTDLWPTVESPPGGTELTFVRATRDSLLAAADADRIERLDSEGAPVRLHELEGGHWLNIDNPDGLLALLRSGLPRG